MCFDDDNDNDDDSGPHFILFHLKKFSSYLDPVNECFVGLNYI